MKTAKNITLYHHAWGIEKEQPASFSPDARIARYHPDHVTIHDQGTCLFITLHQLRVRWDSSPDSIQCFDFNPVSERYEWSENISYHDYQNVIASCQLKIAVMFCSYRRLSRLVGQIHTLLNQTHPPEKLFVAVKGYAQRDVKKHISKHFLHDNRVVIKCAPNRHMITNLLDSVRDEHIDDFDLIIKIDDDDIYPVDLIETTIKHFTQAKKQNPQIAGIGYACTNAIEDNGRHIGQHIYPFRRGKSGTLGHIMTFTPKVLQWLFLYEKNPEEAIAQTSYPIKEKGHDDEFLQKAIKANGGMHLEQYIDGVVYNRVDCSIMRNDSTYTGIANNYKMSRFKDFRQEEFFYIDNRLARIFNNNQLTWVNSKENLPIPCQLTNGTLIFQNTRYTYDNIEAQYKKS